MFAALSYWCSPCSPVKCLEFTSLLYIINMASDCILCSHSEGVSALQLPK